MAGPARKEPVKSHCRKTVRIKTRLWELIKTVQEEAGPDADMVTVPVVADPVNKYGTRSCK